MVGREIYIPAHIDFAKISEAIKRNRRYNESSPKKQKTTGAAEVNVNNESHTKRASLLKESFRKTTAT